MVYICFGDSARSQRLCVNGEIILCSIKSMTVNGVGVSPQVLMTLWEIGVCLNGFPVCDRHG